MLAGAYASWQLQSRIGLWERGQTKQHPFPPDWRLGEGLLTSPLKNTVITETEGALHVICIDGESML